jgi:hypothetical protein
MKALLILITITMVLTACGTTSVYQDDGSKQPSGYHRNEYSHRHGNAPPVPDQNQLPQK